MVRAELLRGGVNPKQLGQLTSIQFFLQQAGAFFGAYIFAVFADRVSRKSAFYLWFVLAWAAILAYFWGIEGSGSAAFSRSLFLGPVLGFCTLGPFAGYTIYFPELFPTRLRATGCGFCYNAARILAASAPFALGGLQLKLGGFARPATVVSGVLILGFIGTMLGPETKGKGLPEDG
jgi:MFS family permease